MRTPIPPKASLLVSFILFAGAAFAQTAFDGNVLPDFLGKADNSSEFTSLVKNYHCETSNGARYFSKEGIELIIKGGVLREINLYSKSSVYGTFAGALPNKLRFGMSPGEVKSLLGKPTESYSNGYCEFDLQGYTVSCWFEGGGLNQVGLASK